MKKIYFISALAILSFSCKQKTSKVDFNKMMIRMAELEIEVKHLPEYLSELKKEARASMELESGVISIFPMYKEQNPTEITIVEIYADKKAYEAHLETPHFKEYKANTLKMVQSLKLIDMTSIDSTTMYLIFKKLN
tara:strand:- start:133 stop:540 length:408 start_codon:yes stop_codon:yes gene_type:complete